MSVDFIAGDLVRHADHGLGRVEEASGSGELQSCTVRFARAGRRTVARDELALLPETEAALYDLVRLALAEADRERGAAAPIGARWQGGELVLRPADPALAPKTFPIETFFHKIVMVRERLRVLEQKVNGNARLADAEKVELQQHITQAYGSLTTFNVLFREREDWFVGQRGERA